MKENNLVERIRWLIRLRWMAVAGVIFAVFFSRYIFNVTFPPIVSLFTITAILGFYNLFFAVYLESIKNTPSKNLSLIANFQISLDLLSLALLIHFSGGIENPFLFYFIFHMIIASILLSRKAAFLQATFAVVIFCSMVVLEYAGILRHYCLAGFVLGCLQKNILYITGFSFAFISTLYIAVYMASSISIRLKQREESLEEANSLLNEKDRLKSEYVLRVTHDIKEHLAAIEGCLEPVIMGITGELNPKQYDLVKRAAGRASKLTLFVKALLRITRIKLSSQLKMDYFSLKDAVGEAINSVELKAGNKKIIINSNIDPVIDNIKGEREYIQETIVNLLANSIKYTPANGKVNLNISDKGDSVFIQIKDSGIGIDKKELPKLFEEFYRAPNAREIERDGTGLGLSIAKQIVERHNGRIWIESEGLNKGTIISIILPKGGS